MEKIDFKKNLPFFKAAKKPVTVVLPPLHYLMIDGAGDPNTSKEYTIAVEALYSVAYNLKFMIKASDRSIDYTVLPLEGLWWATDMNDFINGRKDNWLWTAMILQPEFITAEMVDAAKKAVAIKKSMPALERLRFEVYEEGESAQILHIGPYNEEKETIEQLHQYIQSQGGKLDKKHHEIYLSDPRKSAPEKLKTIIRQPFSR